MMEGDDLGRGPLELQDFDISVSTNTDERFFLQSTSTIMVPPSVGHEL